MTEAVEKAQALLARIEANDGFALVEPGAIPMRRALSALLAEHTELQQAVALKDAAYEALDAQLKLAHEELAAQKRHTGAALSVYEEAEADCTATAAHAARWKRLAKRLFRCRIALLNVRGNLSDQAERIRELEVELTGVRDAQEFAVDSSERWYQALLHARFMASGWKTLAKSVLKLQPLAAEMPKRAAKEAPLPCFANGCGCWREGS